MRFVVAFLILGSVPARADWSGGLGYHNPPGASVGLNLMDIWTNWAFEIGIGYVGSAENWNSKNNAYSMGGDLNLKYLFSSGLLRPYLEGGVSAGLAAAKSGSISAGASVSQAFGGGGIFLMGSDLYVYLSFLILNEGEFQAGFGVPF